MKPDTRFKFGEWLPDQPDLDNPGVIEARNVLVSGGTYGPYKPLSVSGSPINGPLPVSALRVSGSGQSSLYVAGIGGGSSYLSAAAGAGGTWTNVTPVGGLTTSNTWSMTQYRQYCIVTSGAATDRPQYSQMPLGVFSKLTGTYGDAPLAKVCGTIGQFVFLGNLPGAGGGFGSTMLQWSGIDAPFNWPTPNTADAIAQQSGQQFLDYNLGAIEAICPGDQWAVVLCDGGIVRLTYIGGQVVFQFDPIYRAPTALGPNCWAKVAGLIYCVGAAGFLVTDGTTAVQIGDGKIDRWFQSNADFAYPWNFSCGVDYTRKIIYWTFPLLGNSGVPNHWVAYNYLEKRFTHGDDTVQTYVRGEEAWVAQYGLQGFVAAGTVGTFTGTAGSASFVTPEAEFFPGKRSVVTAVTPQVTGTTSLTVKLGSRSKQTDSVVFTPAVAPDPFTGDSNFFVDNRYHRAEIDITGNFTQAMGGTFDAQPSSAF